MNTNDSSVSPVLSLAYMRKIFIFQIVNSSKIIPELLDSLKSNFD